MEKQPMRTYARKRTFEGKILEGAADLCRLCLCKLKEEATPIFTQQSDFGVSLATRITMCVGLEMMQEDCLPNQICSECCSELDRCYRFRKKCEASYQRLKSHLKAVQGASSIEKSRNSSLILDSVREECKVTKSNKKSVEVEDDRTLFDDRDLQCAENSDNETCFVNIENIEDKIECMVETQQPLSNKDDNICAINEDIRSTEKSSDRIVIDILRQDEVHSKSENCENSANVFQADLNATQLPQSLGTLPSSPAPVPPKPPSNAQTPLIFSSIQTSLICSQIYDPISSIETPLSDLQPNRISILRDFSTSSFQTPQLSLQPSSSTIQHHIITSSIQPPLSSLLPPPSSIQTTLTSNIQFPPSFLHAPTTSSFQPQFPPVSSNFQPPPTSSLLASSSNLELISNSTYTFQQPSSFLQPPVSRVQPLPSSLQTPLSSRCQPNQTSNLRNPPTSGFKPSPSSIQPPLSSLPTPSTSSVKPPPISISSLLTTVLLTVGAMHLQQPSGLLAWDGAVDELELSLGDGIQVMMVLEEEEPDADEQPASPEPTGVPSPASSDPRIASSRQCSVCLRLFTSSSVRARHEREVHARCKPHVCQTCGRAFSQRCGLLRHQMLHNDSRPFRCECGRGFRQRSALKAHQVTHVGKPPLRACPYAECYKRFLYASGLSRHLRWHQGHKFVCADCGRVFLDKSALRRHLATDKHRRQVEKGDT